MDIRINNTKLKPGRNYETELAVSTSEYGGEKRIITHVNVVDQGIGSVQSRLSFTPAEAIDLANRLLQQARCAEVSCGPCDTDCETTCPNFAEKHPHRVQE